VHSIHVADVIGQPAPSSWRIGLVITDLDGPKGPRVAVTFAKPRTRIRKPHAPSGIREPIRDLFAAAAE
jgi:hypothetical protein